MNVLYSLLFAAGVAAFTYSKIGRVGYTNTKSIWTILATVFVITFLVFITLLTFVFHTH